MKLPPREKIPEAWSVLADGRIEMETDQARIISSDHHKEYIVLFEENTYSSNDCATYWQGYPGYPILAVLMKQGKIKIKTEIIEQFKDLNWHQINEKYKRDYPAALAYVLSQVKDKHEIETEISKEYTELSKLELILKRHK